MTRPDGEVVLQAHVDTSRVEPELEAGTRAAAERAEQQSHESGRRVGHDVAGGIDDELGHHGGTFAHTIERGIRSEHIHVGGDAFEFDKRSIGDVVGNVFHDIEHVVEEAFASGGSNGGKGPFGFITQSIRDAVGAGFNVPGKSPLSLVLIPAFGALAALIGSVLEGVLGLISVLAGLPTILGAVGLEAGALFFAFNNVGTAISQAFAAKNIDEFKKAIEGLTKPAQAFVTTFVPAAKQFVDYLSKGAQFSFFTGLGDKIIPKELKNLRDILYPAISSISYRLGEFIRRFATIIENPLFKKLIGDYIDSIGRWLVAFEPVLNHFVSGLLDFLDGMLPLANNIGYMVLNWLRSLGDWFFKMGNDTKFQFWLYQNLQLFGQFVDLVVQAGKFIVDLLDDFNKAGGDALFGMLMASLKGLADFFAQPIGQKALQGLIHLVEFLLLVFDELVIALGFVAAALEVVGEWVADVIVGWEHIGDSVAYLWHGLKGEFNKLTGEIERLIGSFFNGLPTFFYNAGLGIIMDFVHGMEAAFDWGLQTLENWLGSLTDLLPGSPAKTGPLSGQGWSYVRGQHLARDFARGIKQEVGSVSSATTNMVNSINFGSGAVRVDFNGAVPTKDQAEMTGAAAGQGIADQLMMRNVAFAARTL